MKDLPLLKFAESDRYTAFGNVHIISGRNNPSLDVLLKILERFTYVDSDWLLFGKGEIDPRTCVN